MLQLCIYRTERSSDFYSCIIKNLTLKQASWALVLDLLHANVNYFILGKFLSLSVSQSLYL